MGSGTAAAITIAVIATIMVFAPFIWHLMSMQPVSTKTVTRVSTITTTTTIATPSPVTIERTSFVTITKPMLVTVTTPMPITITKSIFKTLPTTVTRTVTTTRIYPVTHSFATTIVSTKRLTTTRTITVTTTSPIILTSTSYVWATITATKIVKEIQTKTLTKTITTTITTTRVEPNFRLSSWDELHSTLMSDKVKEVYVLILYSGGAMALDNNFVNLINDLKRLAEKNVTIKVLVHPRSCSGWKYGPPGIIAPELVKIINSLNKTLGYERLRALSKVSLWNNWYGFGLLSLLDSAIEAEVLVVFNDGTAKVFILADPGNPKILVIDHVEKIDDLMNPKYGDSIVVDFKWNFEHGVVWNPDKLCP